MELLCGYITSLAARPCCVWQRGRKRSGRRRSECNTPQGHSEDSLAGGSTALPLDPVTTRYQPVRKSTKFIDTTINITLVFTFMDSMVDTHLVVAFFGQVVFSSAVWALGATRRTSVAATAQFAWTDFIYRVRGLWSPG